MARLVLGPRHRKQVDDHAGVRRRMLACPHQRRARDDVADVDRIWDYTRQHNGRCILKRWQRPELAFDARFNGRASHCRLLPGLLLP